MTTSDSTPLYDGETEPESVAGAEEILTQIRTQQQSAWEETPTERQEELSRLRKRTLTDLDDPKQVIPELLQNADDVGGDCTKVTISLTNDELVFRNHEEPMATKNVAALGEFTKSTKNSLSYIGHFGIGFKTVFSVTNTPQIRSGYFSFHYTQDDPETPTPAYEDNFEPFNGAEIRLPFADDIPDQKISELRKQLESIHRLLPYLNNLEEIHVSVHGTERLLKRTVTENGRHVVREKDTEQDEWEVLKQFRVFSEQYSPEGEMLERLATERNIKPENLSNVESNLSVKVAIPVDNDGRPTDWQAEDEQSRLFCYFPTEERTALPFDVQADFLLKPDRQKIRPNHPLNERLLEQAGVALEKAFISFHREQVDPEAILHLLPDPSEDRPSHLETLIESILATVESESCIPDPHGNLHRPEDLLVIPQGLQKVFPFDTVIQAFENTTAVTYPSLDLPSDVRTRLRQFDGPHTVGMEEFLTKLQTADFLHEQSTATLLKFLAEIQRYLNTEFTYPAGDERRRKERIEDAVTQLPILPLQDGRQCSVAGTTNAIHKPPGQSEETYARFRDQLNLLSTDFVQELSQPEDITEDVARKAEELFSGVLEVDELSDRDIVREVINPAFESPDATDDGVLDTYVTFISERSASLSSTQTIKLKGEDGDYHDPDSLYLSSAYVSEYSPEPVFEELTDRTALSAHYLDLNDQSTTDWRRFLTEIGVKDHLDVPKHKANYVSFETKDAIQAFLEQHDDDGTEVYSDETLDPYNGRRDYRWLSGNRHGLTDYQFEESVLSHLQNLLNSNQHSSFWTAFARMTDAHWESTYSEVAYRGYCYSQQSNRYEVTERQSKCLSSFGVFLRENAWLPDEDAEFHRPAHLFERNPSTEGAPVNFLGVSLTDDDFQQFLRIQTHPGIRHTCIQIEQLAEKRTEEDPDKLEKEILTQLYSLADELEGASDETRSDVVDSLQDCRFIRVRNADPEFRTPQEVTWADDIGDFFVAIGEDYHPLESLFVNVLDVPIEASLDDCLTVFTEAEAPADWDAIETAWKEIMRAIYKPDDFNRTLDELRQALEETGYLPSASTELVHYDEIEYVATTPRTAEGLPDDVADTVLSPYYDNRWNRDKAVDNTKTALNVSPLEEALENHVQSPDFNPATELLYEEFPAVFDVAYSVLRESEHQPATTELSKLAQFSLQRPTEIRCDYYLDDNCVIAGHLEDHYIDSEQEHVLLIDDDTAAINLADRISSYLELPERVHSRITRLVKGAVGKERSLLKAYLNDEEITFKPLETDLDDSQNSESSQKDSQPPFDDASDNEQTEDPEPPESEPTPDSQNNQPAPHTDAMPESQPSDTAAIPSTPQQSESRPPSHHTSKSQPDTTTSKTENNPLAELSQPIESSSKTESDQSTHANTPQKTADTGTRKRTPRYNGGGGGQRSNEVGDAGEQFVFNQLVDTLKTQFGTISEVSESTKKTEIVGQRANEQYTTTIHDVSHKPGRGYDIHVSGAELEQGTDELQVASIGANKTALVEVKSTENTGENFHMTFSEYRRYHHQQEDYAVVRVVKALDSPTITNIIGILPDIWNKRHNDLLVRPQGVTIERD